MEKTKNFGIRIPSDTSNQPQVRQALNDVDAALLSVAGGSQEETNKQLGELNKSLATIAEELGGIRKVLESDVTNAIRSAGKLKQ